MKKKIAIALCSLPFALAPLAYAQTGGAPEGTTSPQSGSQTDMGTDGAPNAGGANGASGSAAPAAGDTTSADAASGKSFKDKLQGKSVYNENDDKIGSINDVILSNDDKATHLIVGVGGFVGVGEHDVAIPFDKITESGDKLTLQGYTKDQLKDMPAYEYPKPAPAPAPAPASSPAPAGTR